MKMGGKGEDSGNGAGEGEEEEGDRTRRRVEGIARAGGRDGVWQEGEQRSGRSGGNEREEEWKKESEKGVD